MKLSTALVILSLSVSAVLATPVEKESKRLIKTSEQDPGTWMTEEETFQLKLKRIGFVDITDDRDFSLENKVANTAAIPTEPRFQTVVNDLIRALNRSRVEDFVREFSDFFNRHANSAYGEESQQWLLSEVTASLAGFRGNSSIRDVEHSSWRQNSIIARIEGTDPQLKNEVVILGAHQDNTAGGANSRSPGADDNASGSVVVLETLRVLVASGVQSKRSIEFHWYAAEEQGLLGSAAIAREYKNNNVNVAAMMNLDVVGWQVQGLDVVGIYTDYGNNQLIQFLRVLADEYLTFERRDYRCGYGCSDHASWTNNGFASAMASEYEWNPYMHTAGDTFERVGFEQVMEFTKLAVGFVTEIAEPL